MTAESVIQPISLLELNQRLVQAVAATPGLRAVWVAAETSDVRVSGGHCYLELIQKDPDTGTPLARMRATIWRSTYARLVPAFRATTGSDFTSGLKVMVRVTAQFHPVYGVSVNIDSINPEYTLGDLLRRRREMIARLTAEGIIGLNRALPWPEVPRRVAVISAAGAAGYGDFVHQLFTNPRCLRFSVELFPAVMQGADTAPTILAALHAVAARQEQFDCVVIIRGGGATGDLASFDNYELAASIALFPLPVVVGIGHERDVTLLDYVANMRVKTPTAAAEWLIARGVAALDRLGALGTEILRAGADRMARARLVLEGVRAELPALLHGIMQRARIEVGSQTAQAMQQSAMTVLARHTDRLKAISALLDALSPQATLRRGFSITRVDGRAMTDASQVPAGATIVTTLAFGSITSTAR